MADQKSQVEIVAAEIKRELSTETVGRALLATTFKGLSDVSMRQALMEGMMRGFKFKDFLEKNIYAIPFGKDGYSLITSIDYARKVGMASGIVGKDAPSYEMDADGKNIIACTVTVKKKIDTYVGDFTATVYFDEYNKKSNLWISKPRTMIAKVAEMHALRMACPERLSQSYIEEEIEEHAATRIEEVATVDKTNLKMGDFQKTNAKNKKGKKEADDVEIIHDADSHSEPAEAAE